MSNKNFYNDIKKRYDELKSNIEKIYVFNIATSVENKNENEEKPRIKNVFIVIGLLFKDSYNSAKMGA
jgi:deoxyadenosine/deoxycytidine kinase